MAAHKLDISIRPGGILWIQVHHEVLHFDNIGRGGARGGQTTSQIGECNGDLFSEGIRDTVGAWVDADLASNGNQSGCGRDGDGLDVRVDWAGRVDGGRVDELGGHGGRWPITW